MLRIGLVGCGKWGRNILRDLHRLKVEAHVSDPDAAARQVATDLGADTVSSELSQLPDLDGLIVATPASTHGAVITQALERDVPVLTEKPFTTCPEEAQRLAAAGAGRLFVGHVWRYHPGVEALAGLVSSGALGRIEMVRTIRTNWTSPRRDIDPIWTLAPHDLSIGLEILGHLPSVRYARIERLGDRPVGVLAVLGERPALVLETSTRYGDKRREVRVHGTEGVARLAGGSARVLEIEWGSGQEAAPRREERPLDPTPALQRELQAFLAFVQGGPACKTAASEGVQVVRRLAELRRPGGLGAGL